MNKAVYDQLSTDKKKALHKAADETALACASKSAQLADWYLDQLQDRGMVVSDASAELMEELSDIGTKLQAEWLGRVGAEGKEALTAYKNTSDV